MEPWRKVWREGIAPHLSTAGLKALARALRLDDPALIQGITTQVDVVPALRIRDCPVACACAIAYCGWRGDGLTSDTEVSDFFGTVCARCNESIGEDPAGCRWFLNWFDETPREEMRRDLLPEVRLELQRRTHAAA